MTELGQCSQCQYDGTGNCVMRYIKDLRDFDFDRTEWICPQCDVSRTVSKYDDSFICENCGFGYECLT